MADAVRKARDGIDALPSGKWRARYRDVDGKQHAKTFGANEKRKAKAWREGKLAEVRAGTHVDENNRITVGEYAALRVEIEKAQPDLAETTAKSYGNYLRHLTDTPLAGRRLVTVRPSEIEGWLNNRAVVLGPTARRNTYSWLKRVFARAVDDGILSKSPCVETIRAVPRESGSGDRVLERDEALSVQQVRALAAAMPERYRIGVLLQASLGLRVSELLGLRVGDVNWPTSDTVRLRAQLAQDGRRYVGLKTKHSARDLPLAPDVRDALSAHLAAFPPNADGAILTTPHGNPVRVDLYTAKHFKRAVAAAGLPPSTTPHDLRHHAAALLLLRGVPANVVASFLGHGSIALVVRTYSKLMPGSDELTRRVLTEVWSGNADVMCTRSVTDAGRVAPAEANGPR